MAARPAQPSPWRHAAGKGGSSRAPRRASSDPTISSQVRDSAE
ncbi:MAG: hypothetical protein QM788_17240 [Roseateles sp.]